MNQSINCKQCGDIWRKKYPDEPKTPWKGEYVKSVRGELWDECVCDVCNTPLGAGDTAYAISIYTDMTPYYAWEGEYINQITKGEEADAS